MNPILLEQCHRLAASRLARERRTIAREVLAEWTAEWERRAAEARDGETVADLLRRVAAKLARGER